MSKTQEAVKAEFDKTLLADKYDQTTRLIYADWLEERGYDDEAVWQRSWTPEWQGSEDYFIELVEQSTDEMMTLERLKGVVKEFLEQEYLWDNILYDLRLPEPMEFYRGSKFWKQWEIYTSTSVELPPREPCCHDDY